MPSSTPLLKKRKTVAKDGTLRVPATAGMGRPKGSLNKRTKLLARIAQFNVTGELPHMFLLRVSQGQKIEHWSIARNGRQVPSQYWPTFEERLEAARTAAPFFAPKLSAVEYIASVSDAELDAVITSAASEAKIGISVTGAGQTIKIAASINQQQDPGGATDISAAQLPPYLTGAPI